MFAIDARCKANTEILAGVARYAATRTDWELIVTDPETDGVLSAKEASHLVDGMICGQDKAAKAFHLLNPTAVVCIDDAAADDSVNSMLCDHTAIAAAAAKLFLDRKYTHFVYVDTPIEIPFSQKRGNAFEEIIAHNGFSCTRLRFDQPGFTRKLTSIPNPCALFAANDLYARRTADICRSCGLNVPEDVAILGVDDEQILCEFSRPPISSVLPAFESGGFRAAEMLDAIIRRKIRKPRHLMYGVEAVVERRSTQYTGSRLHTAVAHDFIRKHATSLITTSDIAQAARRDLRRLCGEYRADYGVSIVDDLRNHRLKAVAKLLRTTSTPIDLIHGMCGFTNALYLKTLFKKHYGMTMREYRQT